MDEQLFGGLVCGIVALPVLLLGLRFRAGRNLEVISGYHPERIRDRAGFGRFVGTWILLTGALTLGMGVAIALAPPAWATLITLGFVVLLQLPILRLALGIPAFHRR